MANHLSAISYGSSANSCPLKIHSYVVSRDYGFAPNPFCGYCTLATCKPAIRRVAKLGDWVIGTGSKKRKLSGRLIFAMHVSETLTFDEYWNDPRFVCKRPNLRGSKKQAFGDNIYHPDLADGHWVQENSHHSHEDGSPNQLNVDHDTQTDRMLLATEYTYWGATAPKIPEQFRNFGGYDICARRAHKNGFPAEMVAQFLAWVASLGEHGCVGEPSDWKHTA